MEMKRRIIVVTFYLLYLNLRIRDSCSLMMATRIDDTIKIILRETQPYQVALMVQEFKNKNLDTLSNKIYRILTKSILNKKAAIVMDTYEKNFKMYLNTRNPILKDPRYTTLFIIMASFDLETRKSTTSSFIEFQRTIDFITNLSLSSTRPRCLLIIIAEARLPYETTNRMLVHAWRKKVLDLTILQSATKDKSCASKIILHTYNPFSKVQTTACYSSQLRTFPNKLINMYRYPLKVSLIIRDPSVNFERDEEGHPVNINGSDYGGLLAISEKMNFSMILVTPNVSSYEEPLLSNTNSSLLDLIFEGNIDLSGNQQYLHLAMTHYSGRHGERSILTWIDEFVALVPVIPSCPWKFQISGFIMILGVFGHVSFIYLYGRTFKFSRRYWQPHHIFQMLLGNPVPRTPLRPIERLVFFFLFILSLQYSAAIFARLAKIQLDELDQGPYKTLRDIENSDLVLEMHINHVSMTFSDDGDKLLRRLRKKVKLIDDIADCPDRVLKAQNIACLIDWSIAWRSIQSNHRQDGVDSARMKVIRPALWSAPKGIIFSQASPYVTEINRIIYGINEGSLWTRWFTRNPEYFSRLRIYDGGDSTTRLFDQHLLSKLMLIYFSGCTVAFIAFVSEMLTNYVQNQMK